MELDPLSLILLAILVLLLVGLAVRSLRAPLGDVIAFVGLSDSGKTYMVSKLATNDTADPDTQLSIVSFFQSSLFYQFLRLRIKG